MCNQKPYFLSKIDKDNKLLDQYIIMNCHIFLRKFFIFFLRFFKRFKKEAFYKYTLLYDLYGFNFLNQQQAYTFIFLLKKYIDPTTEWRYFNFNLNQKPLYLVQSEVEALLGEDKFNEEKAIILFKNLFLKSTSAQKELYEQKHIYNLGIFRLKDIDFFHVYLNIFKKLVIKQLDEYKETYDLEKREKEGEGYSKVAYLIRDEEKLKKSYKRYLKKKKQ